MALRFDRVATLCLGVPFRVIFPQSNQGCISILMYHRISAEKEEHLSPYFRVNTSPQRFQEQMRFLAESDYKVVTLSRALELLQQNAFSRKHVVITFDDGFEDFYTEAYPVLSKYRFSATMFLPTAFISNTRKKFKDVSCLTWSEIKELDRAGIDFGSHTVHHPKLKELSLPEVESELRDSKAELEQQLRKPVRTFAYPYAYPETNKPFVNELTRILREANYDCCATTIIGNATASDSPFALKRIPVNDCDDESLLAAKLKGAYDWLAFPQRLRKRTARQPVYSSPAFAVNG